MLYPLSYGGSWELLYHRGHGGAQRGSLFVPAAVGCVERSATHLGIWDAFNLLHKARA